MQQNKTESLRLELIAADFDGCPFNAKAYPIGEAFMRMLGRPASVNLKARTVVVLSGPKVEAPVYFEMLGKYKMKHFLRDFHKVMTVDTKDEPVRDIEVVEVPFERYLILRDAAR